MDSDVSFYSLSQQMHTIILELNNIIITTNSYLHVLGQ